MSTQDSDGFSNSTTNSANDARNLYNFLDKNTTRGIKFGLVGYNKNGKIEYSVSTYHKNGETGYNKLNIAPTNLIFFIHNHDGDLDNGNTTTPSNADKNTATTVLNNVGRTTSLFPRFFISLENGSLNEFFQNGKRTESTNLNILNTDLKNIKRYDYFTKNK